MKYKLAKNTANKVFKNVINKTITTPTLFSETVFSYLIAKINKYISTKVLSVNTEYHQIIMFCI